MGFVIGGMLLIAVLVGGVWLALFLTVRGGELRERAREARERERERLLETPGERLRCVGCGAELEAPLTPLGCPECHTHALVVPEKHLDDDALGRMKVRNP